MKKLNVMRMLRGAGAGSLLAAVATTSVGQEGGYYYGGVGVGQSRASIDEGRIGATLLGAGLTMDSMSRDQRDTGYKLFGGYQINRHFGLEAGYFNLGKFGFNATTTPAGTLGGQIKLDGLNLDLVGTLPLSQRWSALGRVGAQYARARDSFNGTGAVSVLNANPRESKVNYKVGAGLQYAFSPSFLMRGEVERFRVNDAVGNHGDVNLFSVSLVFPFGREPVSVPRARVEPAPVMAVAAPAPPPPPPAVVAAAPVAAVVAPLPRKRVSFSADSLFTFDESGLRREGKAELDTLAQELKSTRFEVVTVEGHTDRLGSGPYNHTLSTQRAEVVKGYLVSSGGIDATKIRAVGKGETVPVTKAGDCRGSKTTPKLIACLQPDRRVEVEAEGSRNP
jgi:OmpA-OmpF porin, OOP family